MTVTKRVDIRFYDWWRMAMQLAFLAHSLPLFESVFLPFLYPSPRLLAGFCEVKAFSHAFRNTDFVINSNIEQIRFFFSDVIFFCLFSINSLVIC